MGSCTKGKGIYAKLSSFLKGSIGFCFKHIKWRQQIENGKKRREKNNVPVALVVLGFHLDRKDRKVLSLRERDSPDSRRGPAQKKKTIFFPPIFFF